jgi:hypothetical protein
LCLTGALPLFENVDRITLRFGIDDLAVPRTEENEIREAMTLALGLSLIVAWSPGLFALMWQMIPTTVLESSKSYAEQSG